MSFRVDESETALQEIDRFDGGVGWIAHPEEAMKRASHALEIDGEVWVFDPVDADGVDELLASLGEVAGVVVMLDRHKRDAGAIAKRHDAAVYLPEWFDGVSEEVGAPVVRFGDELADTGLESFVVKDGRFWQEVGLYDPAHGTLIVPESLGTVAYFLAGDEPLGVHPMRRLSPPRGTLGGYRPERILVGHGEGIHDDAARILSETLDTSRRRTPRVYAGAVRQFLPF
ncbi:hypothetical protein [Natronosalvus rutilus]|uniref:Uncharacterized protein n=1 Tax=Natronosalvus rutilus TaxID=2953753 RepID=A0A9E7SV80_9EURY|nr:hypothetical protein [Natronosalvus rutilus]UTF52018.1 hypothetical protein NGM29_09370 [Natronosalvus rutilus]